MILNRSLTALLLLVLSGFFDSTDAVFGQEKAKPFATVSIAPLERSLPEFSYLLSAFDMAEMTGMIEMMTGAYTKGIDRSRPIGVFLSMAPGDDSQPEFQICLPVTDHELWFQAIAGMGLEPEDLGHGMYEIAVAGQFIFAKVANGWLYMGQSEESLSEVIENPVELLGDLPQRYNFAIRLDLEQISPEARRSALDQMRSQVEQNVAEQFGEQLGDQLEAAKEAGDAQLDELQELMKDVQQIVLGFLTESDQKRVSIDAAVQFLPGTKLAAQMDAQAGIRSEFTGLQVPDAAAHFRLTAAMSTDEDKAAAKKSLQEMIRQVKQTMQRTELPKDRATLLEHLIVSCSKVLEQTIDEGIVDGAMSMSYEEDILRVQAGVRVADGPAIESQLKEFIAGLSNASEIEFKPDFGTEGSWRLHRLTAKLPNTDQSIRTLLGPQIEIFVAATDKKILICLAPDGEVALRAGIRQLESSQAAEVTPMEIGLKVGELVRLMQKTNLDPSMEEMLTAVEQLQSDDQIKITTTALPRGFVVRASIQEGVLKALGAMVKSSDLMPAF